MRRRGFTLIEMVVVCAILGTLATLVYPNVVGMKSRRDRDAIYADVLRLAQMGREMAIQTGQTYSLSLNSGTTVVLKQDADAELSREGGESTTSQTSSSNKQKPLFPSGTIVSSNGNDQSSGQTSTPLSTEDSMSVSFPTGVTAGELSLDGKASSTSDFVLHFYPDARSEGGGFEMIDGNFVRSLVIDRSGLSKLQEGNLPIASANSWEAGQYEQRATS